MLVLLFFVWSFQDRSHPHAAGCADGNKAAAVAFLRKKLGHGGDNTGAGSAKGMAQSDAASFNIHPGGVYRSPGFVQAQFVFAVDVVFPCLQGAENLAGKGFVDFVKVEVLQRQIIS